MSNKTIAALAEKNDAILGVLIDAAKTMINHTTAAKNGYKATQEEINQMIRVAEQLAKIPSMAADNIKRMNEAL